MLAKSEEKGMNNVWIGVHDQITSGKYLYNSDNSEVIWTKWGPGEPNNRGRDENCVEISWGWGNGKWYDEDCNALRPFVCEKNEPASTEGKLQKLSCLNFQFSHNSQ